MLRNQCCKASALARYRTAVLSKHAQSFSKQNAFAPFTTATPPERQQAATQVNERFQGRHDLHLNVSPSSWQKLSEDELPSKSSSATGVISRWVHQTNLNDLDPKIIERVKYIILDGLACALTAAQLPESRVAAQSIFSMESPGNCTVIGWDRKLGPLPAALLNSTFIQGFELDDVHREAPWHANSIILPALFAAIEHSPSGTSQHQHLTGASFLNSALIGFELGGRIGRSLSGKEMLSRGWHSGAVFGPAAAAAAVSRQLGLSPRQIEDAMGTASTQACGLMSAQYEAMAKRMQHGFASRNGLFAALTARENYTGIDQVFERPYGGYLAVFGQGSQQNPSSGSRDQVLIDQLGDDWSAFEGICIKPYASMVGTHGAIDCVSRIQGSHADKLADPSSIKSIKVELNKSWFHHSGQEVSNPITVIGAQMSTRYCVAAQIIDKDVLAGQFTSEKLNRNAIWELIEKTTCEHNEDLDQDKKSSPTRLTIEFNDGLSITEETNHPSTTASPMKNEDIKQKWRTLASDCIDNDRMNEIETMVLNLEKLDNVADLIRLLASQTRCPI